LVTPCIIMVGQNHIYVDRIWPYIWWFPCQRYIHCMYIGLWPTKSIGVSHSMYHQWPAEIVFFLIGAVIIFVWSTCRSTCVCCMSRTTVAAWSPWPDHWLKSLILRLDHFTLITEAVWWQRQSDYKSSLITEAVWSQKQPDHRGSLNRNTTCSLNFGHLYLTTLAAWW
jgi:hypothetical protein